MSFESLGLSDPLVRGVRAAGYRSTTAIQDEAIPRILGGHDLFGVGKTGSGKTAAFCLPMLQRLANLTPVGVPHGVPVNHRRTRALVLSPTRESAHQIGERLKVYGQHMSLTSAVLHAGGNHASQTLALRNGVDILVATPGWLHELMVQGYVYLAGLQFAVIDEADRMLQAGMLPYLTGILRALPGHRQSVLFSETLGDAVQEFAETFLKHPVKAGFKTLKSKPAAKSRGKTSPSVAPGKVSRRAAPANGAVRKSPKSNRSASTPASSRPSVGKSNGNRSTVKASAPPSKSVASRTASTKPVRTTPVVKTTKVTALTKSSGSKTSSTRSAAGKVSALSKTVALPKSKSVHSAGKPKTTISNAAKINSSQGKQARAAKPRSAVRSKITRSKPQTTKSAARGRSA